MKINFEEFTIKQCDINNLSEILHIQKETLAEIPSADILRENTDQMLEECLNPPHYTVGAWYNDELAAFSVLYYPHDKEEDLSHYIKTIDITGLKAANTKLCIVRKCYRGNGLQYNLEKIQESHAVSNGVDLLCATVSPKNQHSINNLLRAGYTYDSTINKYGFERRLYIKLL